MDQTQTKLLKWDECEWMDLEISILLTLGDERVSEDAC